MGWLDWADVYDPAPAAHAGYAVNGGWIIPPEVDPSLKSGLTLHLAAGSWSPPGYKPSDLMRSRGNSWDATVMLNGKLWKHRPRPTFVNWHAGGPAQNLATCGFEMEGTGPWTAAQKATLLLALADTWDYFGWATAVLGRRAPDRTSQESVRQTILAVGKGALYEHNWFDSTSCPDGRDDWAWLVPALRERLEQEDDMTPEEVIALIKAHAPAAVYAALAIEDPSKFAGLKSEIREEAAAVVAAHVTNMTHGGDLTRSIVKDIIRATKLEPPS